MVLLNTKRGQVWVETVIYTLIGLTLIGIVLAVVTPKVNEYKDRALIDQTIEALNVMDTKITEIIREGTGNKRSVDVRIKRGALYFDLDNDEIIYELNDSKSLYSEPGVEVQLGRITILTTEGENKNSVTLKIEYKGDLIMNRRGGRIAEGVEKFTAASTPYTFFFEHEGFIEEQEGIREIILIEESKG